MHSLHRPLTALIATFALAALFAVPAFSADREFPATAAAVAKPATLGVLACKSNAYYSGRQLSFRARISRQALDVPQKLAVKVSVYRRNNEDRKFKRISAEKWASASDPSVGIYQHDVIVSNNSIETRAEYKAKAQFRWSNATTGLVESKKSVWSKLCKQRTKLPRVFPAYAQSVQVPGAAQMTHKVTVVNSGASEALNIPVTLTTDTGAKVDQTIDSIGPKQAIDVSFTVKSCNAAAKFELLPTPLLKRPSVVLSSSLTIEQCK